MPELRNLLELLSLAPGAVGHAMVLLSFLFMCSYLLRTACMSEGTRSVPVHMLVCVLTLLPAVVLAAMLALGALRYPDRAWTNLGIAALLYLPWYAGGRITRLVRSDTEGADVGWLTMGALVTFPVGLLAAIVFG
jgi:hypothetical protein